MLHKLFGIRKHKPPPPLPPPSSSAEERSSALKIIHAGGLVESYYMAVPANRIMEKYRCSILARPDVFRRPWDAVVRPEEILVPGQKFFVVPRRTLKKLRRRIHKPVGESFSSHSFVSQSLIDVSTKVVSQRKDDFSSKSFQQSDVSSISSVVGTSKNNGKTGVRIRRVRFFGIDTKQQDNYSDSISMEKKGSNAAEKNRKEKGPESQPKRRVRHLVSWQPTLTAIREIQVADD